MGDHRRTTAHGRLELRYESLKHSRRTAPLVATCERFIEIGGVTQGALIAIELFTTMIPLMIIGFSYFTDFADTASVGDLFIRRLGLEHPLDDRVRDAFGTSSGLKGLQSFFGLAGFLVWGIPMSITVATMFARAWRREQFRFGTRLWRGAAWFVLYLAIMIVRQRIGFAGSVHSGFRYVLLAVAVIPIWAFWSISPRLLVRDGGRGGWRPLLLAGAIGAALDGILLPIAARVVIPILLAGWEGFGPIGVAMTLMTWCGVMGVGWAVTACAGAVVWERTAPARTVIETQVDTHNLRAGPAAPPA